MELTLKPPTALDLGHCVSAIWDRSMENPKAATMRQAQEAFAAWKNVNDQINLLESTLQRHVPSRDAPVSGVKTDLQALRLEAERLLLIAQHALLTIKTPRSSNGDSTWG